MAQRHRQRLPVWKIFVIIVQRLEDSARHLARLADKFFFTTLISFDMKQIPNAFRVLLATGLIFTAFLLAAFRPIQNPATLTQKFEVVANAYLSQHYQMSLANTQRTLLSGAALDAKVTQIIQASCAARQTHIRYVLSKYKLANGRAALLVTGAAAPAPGEFLMFSVPNTYRVTYYQDMTNFALFVSTACDSFRTVKGQRNAGGGGGGFSVFADGFNADDPNCVCTSECNNIEDSGFCPTC
jgi:hypothetical protein